MVDGSTQVVTNCNYKFKFMTKKQKQNKQTLRFARNKTHVQECSTGPTSPSNRPKLVKENVKILYG